MYKENLTFLGLHVKKMVERSKGNLTTLLSWQRQRLILCLGHRSNKAFCSAVLASLLTVGVSLQ